MFYNEIFPWYISVTTHVLDFRFGTQSRKKETEEGVNGVLHYEPVLFKWI